MSLTQTSFMNVAGTMKVITASWTSETSGSFTSAVITGCSGMYLMQARTAPGNCAPTSNYDITIKDADGVDAAGGLIANRSATAAETIFPAQVSRPIDSDLTLAISGNIVDRANGTVKLYFSATPVAIVVAA